MAFWLIAIGVAATAATVGTGAASIAEGKKQTAEALKNQKEMTLASAYVEYGQSLSTLPGAIPI